MRELNIIKSLISRLEKKGISTYFDTDISRGKRLENLVFEKNGKKKKIYEPLIFREFGQSDVNDDTFYNFYFVLINEFFRN